ncbi:MAG: CocE/NonD family hydrolase [Gemmatimonadales bacterium]
MSESDLSRRTFATWAATALGVGPELLRPGRPTAADDGVIVERNVMVAMRDGVRLACDIHRPAGRGRALPGPFPVILERTPYGKQEPSRSELTVGARAPWIRDRVAAYFVARGFIVVYQDSRGRYQSEGRFEKYLSEARDGFDTVEWIVAQPWCNGRIGTKGLSYAAHTQGALATLAPRGLAAMFIDSGGFSNAYQGGIRLGGAFEMKQVTWAHRNALEAPDVVADPARLAALGAVDLKAWFARWPWKRGDSPLTLSPEYETYVFDQWEHGNFDDYWKDPSIYAAGYYDRYADVPMVHMSAWYDPYARTATENYIGLSRRKKGPVSLLLGPWTHGNRTLTYAGDVDFGPAAPIDGNLAPDFFAMRLAFFQHWLQDRPGAATPAVQYFLMGGGTGRRNGAGRLDHGGEWRTATDWPVPEARPTSFYLHPNRTLGGGPAAAGDSLSYIHDPADPVPSIGGPITSGAPVMEGGAYDQREGPRFFGSKVVGRALADRPDVLSFRTAPLGAEVAVVGPVRAELWISSDAPDTDFTCKLVDEYPPNADYPQGYAMNLCDGILRVRYRDSWEHPTLMTPGQVYRIEVELYPTANRFAAGHRIRLDVASSNYPRFDVNPNTGEPEGRAETRRPARNTVWMTADRPSRVVLPVVS